MTSLGRYLLACLTALLLFTGGEPAHARMALVVGEPFGSFGTMMPNGHAGIYMSNLCVETAVHLRTCRPGELGAVVSRYHDLRHPELDWMAFPLPVFLYGTEDPAQMPALMTGGAEVDMRERYRAQHLSALVPDLPDRHGDLRHQPYGDWGEGIGSAFDRRLFVYAFDTTSAQDAAVLGWLNGSANHRAYTLGRANCADFAADLLRLVLPPPLVHRNRLGDLDMTTPKQLARVVDGYGRAHPDLHLAVYEVPQLPGSLRRSRPIRGAAEALLKTKRYLATLLVIQPEFVLMDWIFYEKRGKWTLGQDAAVATPATWGTDEAAGTAPPDMGSDGRTAADAP